MATIYEKSVNDLLKDYVNLQNDNIFTKKDVINWFAKNFPKIKTNTITAHLCKFSANDKNRIHYHAHDDGRDDVVFKINEHTYRKYNVNVDSSPIYNKSDNKNIEINDEEITNDITSSSEFAYEEDLKNYLSKNLDAIEPGLRLYEEEGITGLEYEVNGRFIDILAVDKDNNYVVIELKVSKTYDKVIGQLLRYKNWIKKEQAELNQKVREMIIGKEISNDLYIACAGLSDVELFEYELSVKIKKMENEYEK